MRYVTWLARDDCTRRFNSAGRVRLGSEHFCTRILGVAFSRPFFPSSHTHTHTRTRCVLRARESLAAIETERKSKNATLQQMAECESFSEMEIHSTNRVVFLYSSTENLWKIDDDTKGERSYSSLSVLSARGECENFLRSIFAHENEISRRN